MDCTPSLPGMNRNRVTAENKKIINNDRTVDCNQLVPIKYKWAWHYYLDGCANNWMPTEVSMQRDIEQWKDPKGFTPEERHVIKRVLGFFATAESLVGNNLVLAVYRCVDNPECRQYLLRQAFEEAIHIHAFQYIVQSLSLDEGELFNMYREVETIYKKDEHAMSCTDSVLDPNLDTKTTEGLQTLKYVLRDESIHMNFGIELINTIVDENPAVWTGEFKAQMIDFIKRAVKLELDYIQDCLRDGILGLNQELLKEYVQYLADRRFEKLRLPQQYGSGNPFPWMSEVIDLKKEKNFFETRVTEYQTGGALEW
ncbi:MAG: ribonucleotide-diphosphate reductase subunit beta [Candidatus Omnitrophica bacterium]|nr:ribonucleotide-diphosphate reductase subunit beta [Candidatus Omnitrophota bacterium]